MSLQSIDTKTGQLTRIKSPYDEFSSLTNDNDGNLFSIVFNADTTARIVNLTTNKVLKITYEIPIEKGDISVSPKNILSHQRRWHCLWLSLSAKKQKIPSSSRRKTSRASAIARRADRSDFPDFFPEKGILDESGICDF